MKHTGAPQKDMYTFLKACRSGVLATCSEGVPHVATLYYTVMEDFTVYFLTKTDTRKYTELKENSQVAFVVSTEEPPRISQLYGTAEILKDPEEKARVLTDLVAVHTDSLYEPPFSQIEAGAMAVIKIVPTETVYRVFG